MWVYGLIPMLSNNGPVFYLNQLWKNKCKEHWWHNILFISNYESAAEQCAGWTWYVSNDMQFYLLSIVLCIVFAFSKLAAIISSLLLLMASHIAVFIIFNKNQYKIFDPTNNQKIWTCRMNCITHLGLVSQHI